MRKIILILMLISLLLLVGCSKSPEESSNINTVKIVNFAFEPAALTVKAGTTLVWINEDTAAHKIKSDTFNSQNLKKADSFSQTFSEPGAYEYICSIHPSMKGKVVVE